MDDPRYEQGMPLLDRQGPRLEPGQPANGAVGGTAAAATAAARFDRATGRAEPPRSVPELRPTPLQHHYVLLSAPALVLGAVAITVLEAGAPLSSAVVKACVIVGAPLLAVANADALVRIWRSAWAWMPVDRGRGLFRLAWTGAGLILYGLLLLAAVLVLAA